MGLPTRLDRYPAKMVSRLADRLIDRYASGATRLLDPFCGSGAILVAANRAGIPVTGVDLNPVAALFSRAKLKGFSAKRASELASRVVSLARSTNKLLPINWEAKDYWFTGNTLEKFERLRLAAKHLRLQTSNEGMAVLLSLCLSVRLCSRADQRSPKPFISKEAIRTRRGRHFDPYRTLLDLLQDLGKAYGTSHAATSPRFFLGDLASDASLPKRLGKHSHVITSPPYINAQDYFRNFKLELYVLEGLLPFEVDLLRERFIGTERGDLMADVPEEMIRRNQSTIPKLRILSRRSPRLASVVHRYLCDMDRSFDTIAGALEPNACFVLVCGDNLIGGIRIRTWQVLQTILESKGFTLFDVFSDTIENRMLAPKRCGHKGLIKEEVICAFRKD